MLTLLKGILNGIVLLFTFDAEIYFIISVSLRVSFGGVFIASVIGVPLGFLLATKEFRGRRALVVLTNTLVGVPTVVVGLFFFCIFSQTIGILSPLELLYTRAGMIVALGALGVPLVVNLTNTAIRSVDPAVHKTALTLGAGPFRAAGTLLSEARYGLVGALVITFGRLISEVGIATMIGGNIRWSTRTMTTFVMLQKQQGEFAYAIALGVALLVIVLIVNVFLGWIQRRGER
jgi:tungstate transport system permease protein